MTNVTAVVTCFNQGSTIAATLASLQGQTTPPVQTLVVDDGSTDPATIAALNEISDASTRVIRIPNGKVSRARNVGIDAASSDYVLCLDSDDLFEPTFLEKATARLDASEEVGLVSSWIETMGLARWQVKPEGGDLLGFLHKNNCPGQVLMRRVCWAKAGGYREDMIQGYEDWDFYIAVTKHGWRAEIIPEFLLKYHIAASSSNTAGYKIRPQLVREIVKNHREVYERHLEDVICMKEQALLERNDEVRELLLGAVEDRLAHPNVSFGDGGMAFAVQIEMARRARH
jgi:glycosyltransferase involved in cell wall biosynthesis